MLFYIIGVSIIGESLAARGVAAMALNTTSIIDVVAFGTAPVIRTRNVVFASDTLRPIRS